MKILLLLFMMVALIGFLRTYLPQEKLKKWITGRHEFLANFLAAIFGAITPFCSCSSIPIFLSFLKGGLPLGVAFSFLVTSPLINEYLVVLMLGFFGLKITLFYVLSGLVLGVFSGTVIGRLKLEKNIEHNFRVTTCGGDQLKSIKYKDLNSRIIYGVSESWEVVRSIWLWVLAGVLLGALIHNYVPDRSIQALVQAGGIFSVPLAVLLGVPMYGSCAAIVPVAVVLFQKGVPIGTALAFMMAVSALSLPEAVILRRAMKLKLIGIFFGIVAVGIIILGYLMNWLAML